MTCSRTRADLAAFFERRNIQVCKAPLHVLLKARRLVHRLEQGTPYWQLHGKRLASDRSVVSIPVGRDWRILARDISGQIVPQELLSHERYNRRHLGLKYR